MKFELMHFQENSGVFEQSLYVYLGDTEYHRDTLDSVCFIFEYLLGVPKNEVFDAFLNDMGYLSMNTFLLDDILIKHKKDKSAFVDTSVSFTINLADVSVDLHPLLNLKKLDISLMMNVKSSLSTNDSSLLLVETKEDEFVNALFSIPGDIVKSSLNNIRKLGTLMSPEYESYVSLLATTETAIVLAQLHGLKLKTTTTAISMETLNEKYPKIAALLANDYSQVVMASENVFPCYG